MVSCNCLRCRRLVHWGEAHTIHCLHQSAACLLTHQHIHTHSLTHTVTHTHHTHTTERPTNTHKHTYKTYRHRPKDKTTHTNASNTVSQVHSGKPSHSRIVRHKQQTLQRLSHKHVRPNKSTHFLASGPRRKRSWIWAGPQRCEPVLILLNWG